MMEYKKPKFNIGSIGHQEISEKTLENAINKVLKLADNEKNKSARKKKIQEDDFER